MNHERHERTVDELESDANWKIQRLADERKRYAEKPSYAMHLAAADGDIEKIKDILKSGRFNLKHSDRFLGTALHAAIHFRQVDSIRMLLWAGANPEILSIPIAGDEKSFTALGLACDLGYLEMVKVLWEKGVSRRGPSEYVGENWSAIEIAAPMGHGNVLAFLLTEDNDWTKEEKNRALGLAAFQWKPDAVRALLSHIHYETEALGYALHRASHETERLCGIADPPLLDKAEYPQQARVIENILRTGINVDYEIHGETALLEASKSPHTISALKELLQHHADPNFQSHIDGQTALHIASSKLPNAFPESPTPRLNTRAITLLLDHNASLTIPDHNSQLPVHIIARNAPLNLLQLAMSKDTAAISITNLRGETLLHAAATGCQLDNVRFLIASDINILSRSTSGSTAIQSALDAPPFKARREVLESLVWGGDIEQHLEDGERTPRSLQRLLCRTAKLRIPDREKAGLTKWALEMGADPNGGAWPRDERIEGGTPLHWAAEEGALGMVEVLLQSGADARVRDEWEREPVDVVRLAGAADTDDDKERMRHIVDMLLNAAN